MAPSCGQNLKIQARTMLAGISLSQHQWAVQNKKKKNRVVVWKRQKKTCLMYFCQNWCYDFFFLMYIFWWCVLTVFQKKTKAQLDLYSLPTKQGGSVKLLKPDFNAWNIPKLTLPGTATLFFLSRQTNHHILNALDWTRASDPSSTWSSSGGWGWSPTQLRGHRGALTKSHWWPHTHSLPGHKHHCSPLPTHLEGKIQISFKVSIFNGSRNSTFSF